MLHLVPRQRGCCRGCSTRLFPFLSDRVQPIPKSGDGTGSDKADGSQGSRDHRGGLKLRRPTTRTATIPAAVTILT